MNELKILQHQWLWSPVAEENVDDLLEEETGDSEDQTLNSVRLRDT